MAIGASCSSAAKAGMPILWKMRIPSISPSTTAPFLTDPESGPDFAGYLRTCHNDKVQGAVAAEFIFKKLGLKKAAAIHDGGIMTQSLAQVFADTFKKLGGTMTSIEAISPGDTDMRPVLTKIASAAPQMIYMPMFPAETAFCVRQSKEISGLEKVAIMGSDGSFAPVFLAAAGNAAIGMYHSSPDFTAMDASYSSFLEKYKQKYGVAPEAPYHAHAYDAMFLIFEALEKAAVVKGDALEIDRDTLNKALHETKGMKGLTGTITCTANGDCADPKIAVYQLTEADFKANKMSTVPFWKRY
jgi:branched-chain amino acid transport system substrate-binding protein